MIKVYTPFSYLWQRWNNHMTKFYEVISCSRYPAKQNCRLKFFEHMEINPTRQDVLQI